MGIFDKFKIGFKKSASAFTSGLKEIIVKKEINDENLNKIEEFLIQSDVGVEAASEIKEIISRKKIDPNKDLSKEINFILKEYQKGNYVVVGADWNHVLPGVDDTKFKYTEQIPDWRVVFPSDWTPKGWKWGVETSIPTCRSDRTPYKKGVNFVTIIDGFLVSPNVEIKNVKGFDLGFKDSDHNPVEIVVKAIK
jgi:hypothetical protein